MVLGCISADLDTKADVTKTYIDWAVEEGFQVIDVNIPKVVSIDDVSRDKFSIHDPFSLHLTYT